MKTINLRGIANPMSEKEMKNTIGGVVQLAVLGIDSGGSGGGGAYPCNNTKCKKNSDCSQQSACVLMCDAGNTKRCG